MRSLPDLLNDGFAPEHAVAIDNGKAIPWAAFVADIAATRAEVAANDSPTWALFEPDTYRFAVALLALLACGRRVYLPGDNRPATLAALREAGAVTIGDLPGARPILHASTERALPVITAALTGEVVIYTSGSTGQAKAIPKTLLQIDRELQLLEQVWGERLDDSRVAGTVSHQHFYGLLFQLLWPLCSGRSFWRRPFSEPTGLARSQLDLASEQGCCWVMSPAQLHRLDQDHMPWAALSGKVSAVFSSGGPLRAEAATALLDSLGQAPVEVLGSSETGGIAWRIQTAGDGPWTPFPGTRFRQGDGGALEIQSPLLPDTGWFRTADAVKPCTDGRFTLLDRIDRIVKVEGKRVALAQIEQALLENSLLSDCSVVMLEGRRQVLGAVVVLSEEGRQHLAAEGLHRLGRSLRKPLLASLPALAVPRIFRPTIALPRNPQGKLPRAVLAAEFKPATQPRVLTVGQTENDATLALYIPADLPCFAGHFDRAPVLPGVVQLHWATHFARQYLGLQGDPGELKAIKFQALARPDTVLQLRLHRIAPNWLGFSFHSAAGQHSQGRMHWQKAD